MQPARRSPPTVLLPWDQGRGHPRTALATVRTAPWPWVPTVPLGEEVSVVTGASPANHSEGRPSVSRQDAALELRVDPPMLIPAPLVEGTAGEMAGSEAVAPPVPVRPVGHGVLAGVGGSMVVVEALHRAAGAVRHHVENVVLRGADLSWTGYAVLALTCQERSVETRTAAAAIGISRGTLTGVVRTLESKSLIRRVPHCRDGRLVLLEPTTTGRRLARRLAPRVTAAEEQAISCLDGGECDALAGLLGRLVTGLTVD